MEDSPENYDSDDSDMDFLSTEYPLCYLKQLDIQQELNILIKHDLLDNSDSRIIKINEQKLRESAKSITHHPAISSCIRAHINTRLLLLFGNAPKKLRDGADDTFEKLAASCAYFHWDFKSILDSEIERYARTTLRGLDDKPFQWVERHQAALGLSPFIRQEFYFAHRLWDVFQNKPNVLGQQIDTLEIIEEDIGMMAVTCHVPFEQLHMAMLRRFLLMLAEDIYSVPKDTHPLLDKVMIKITATKETVKSIPDEIEQLTIWKKTFSEVITLAMEEKLTRNISGYLDRDDSEISKKYSGFFDAKTSAIIVLFRDQLRMLAPVLNFEDKVSQKIDSLRR